MKITIPKTNRKRALYIVDVQPGFLDERNSYIVQNIANLLKKESYDMYITAVFFSVQGDLWEKQRGSSLLKSEDTRVVEEIEELITPHDPVRVYKQTRSGFLGDVDLKKILQDKNIEDVHIVGTQTNDCILATAFDAFDSGFWPYVIEECCEGPNEEMHNMGIALLRRQKMTNHSHL